MEVVGPVVAPSSGGGGSSGAASGENGPFRDHHDVREWQHVDCATGAYSRARFQADRWTRDDGRFNHHYGKLVDSLLRTEPENGLRQAATRQLEVFRSEGPAGTVHVMRSTTRTQLHQATTTGTCTWTSKSSTGNSAAATSNLVGTATANRNAITAASTSDRFSQDFENLQLSVNQLDVTSQKSKAVVSRSASRRPPTRQRSYRSAAGSATTPLDSAQAVAATNLHRVSRLCHQIHATAVKQAFTRPSVTSATHVKPPSDDDANTVEIVELESTSSDNTNAAVTAHGNGSTVTHTNLVRTKSSSSEDIHILSEKSNSANKSIEDLDDLEQLQTWRRTSKLRRSLQFPKQNKESSSSNSTSKPIDIPKNSVSVKKMKEDLEKGRRLNTVLRNNSVDLEALDQILQSVSGSVISDKNSEESECEANKKQKRNSFVTVESIQEVKGRLRRTSSHSSDIYKENGKDDDDVADDGIVVEETSTNGTYTPITAETSRVKSYVYGMEAALLTKKPGVGTGSLESRVKLVNGNSSAKNEDWYNRRKSYGFEQVQAHEDSSSCILKSKKLVESSTDSGICRSSEIVSRTNNSLNENQHNLENGQDHKTNGWKEVTTGQVKKLASTYDSSIVGQGASCWPLKHTELKSTTITIPIVKNNNVVDLPWYDDSGGGEIKRHSIAVDESQYVRRVQPINDPKYRRTSLVTNGSNNTADLFEDETNTTAGIRRTKKVEFCRTEVHFAAESGKVNIVATDEKPPPTQNFRRRRRNSGPLPADFGNKNGTMPVLRFGDSSEEQTMFGVAGDGSGIETGAQMSPRLRRSREAKVNQSASEDRKTFGVVTVNAGDASCQNNMTTPVASERLTAADEDKKDPLSENEIKGILKNKPIKPKPYHLGEAPSPIPIVTYPSSDEETSSKWGVKLRHVEKSSTYNAKSSSRDSPPIWKSTVTVHNFYEKNSQEQVEDGTAVTPEFQKRLRNLRPTRKSECEYASDSDIKRSTLWNQEDSQGMEQKGCYSTKIHFGEGEATVLENDDRLEGNTTWPTLLKNFPNKDSAPQLTSHTVADNPPKSTVPVKVTHTKDGSSPTREQPSPTRKVQRNSWPAVRPDITLVEKLSSPSLVGKTEKEDVVGSHLNNDALKQSLRRIADNIVIRQPKKSEMTYFGVKVSPGPEKKVSQAVIKKEPKLSQKPGLLHHHKKSPSPTRCKFNKPRQESPEPIYENIHINNKYKGKEFDSSILDELTKAADQILQSVNGYTDEDSQSKQSTDEEKKKLETIDEARSLKPTTYSTEQKIPSNQKYKLRHTSSTSSVESVTKKKEVNEKMTTTAERQAALQQQKKKQEKSDSSTSSKAHLKARRLQRASSREALLHSHGSSSEDLPNRIEVAIRKPRLVRKTKSVQLSMTNGLELKKPNTAGDSPAITKLKEDRCINKADERILNSLPEVRHKTAVSTIRSTSEKMSKDKAKYKHEDMKKKTPSKRDTNRGTISATPTMNSTTNSKPTALQSGAAPTSSKSLTPVKVKTVGVTAAKSDRQRYHHSQQQSSSTTATAASAAITQHRISTANIKKCVNGRPTTMVTNLKT